MKFKIGQEVVALSDGIIRREGKVYTVTGYYGKCGCGYFINLDNLKCSRISKSCLCGGLCVHDGREAFLEDHFAPLDEYLDKISIIECLAMVTPIKSIISPGV